MGFLKPLSWALALLAGLGAPLARGEPLGEYEIKAAYLYNLALFTHWPDQALGPPGGFINLCVIGPDPFGPLLTPLEAKRIQARPVRILRLSAGADASLCHVAFLALNDPARLRQVLAPLRQRPVLTVGEADTFIDAGGIVRLVPRTGRIGFQISRQAIGHSGLQVSSKLLRLAELVEPNPEAAKP